MLINNAAYHRVAEFLLQEHFGNAVHGRIYAAIGKLIERGLIADPVTLKNLFDQDGALADIGGAQYLAHLVNAAVTIINAEHYGRTIHDLYLRRELITVGQDIVTEAFQHDLDDAATEQIERAESKLFELASSGQAEGGPQEFRVALTSAITMAQAAFKRDGKIVGVATGFTDLDKKLGGLHPSDLVILAGRPSMGKTALATNIAFNAAKAYQPARGPEGRIDLTKQAEDGAVVAFFSLEMSAEQLATRILAEESGTSSDRIRRGEVRREDFDKFVVASQRLSSVPLLYRRHAGPVGRGLAHPGAAAEAAARSRADRDRLSAADAAERRAGRRGKPGAGDLRDHARAEGHREGAERADPGPVAARRAPSSSARTSGRCSPICANPARSSRMPTSSCSSSARSITSRAASRPAAPRRAT